LTGTAQAFPHCPQCAGFVLVFTQAPEQRVLGLGHRSTQRPPEQAWSASQRTPQPPQLLTSDAVAMQALPQRAYPGWHTKPQVFEMHVAVANAGALQRRPQPPQLLVSLLTSKQTLPHLAYPVLHCDVHVPCTQLAVPPAGCTQVLPQAPQWARLVFKSTHEPLHSTRPEGQSSRHTPAAHTCPTAHVTPQRPQFLGSLATATQALPQV
jgi:hypothetical protein